MFHLTKKKQSNGPPNIMSRKQKRILLSSVVIATILCVIIALSGVAGTGIETVNADACSMIMSTPYNGDQYEVSWNSDDSFKAKYEGTRFVITHLRFFITIQGSNDTFPTTIYVETNGKCYRDSGFSQPFTTSDLKDNGFNSGAWQMWWIMGCASLESTPSVPSCSHPASARKWYTKVKSSYQTSNTGWVWNSNKTGLTSNTYAIWQQYCGNCGEESGFPSANCIPGSWSGNGTYTPEWADAAIDRGDANKNATQCRRMTFKYCDMCGYVNTGTIAMSHPATQQYLKSTGTQTLNSAKTGYSTNTGGTYAKYCTTCGADTQTWACSHSSTSTGVLADRGAANANKTQCRYLYGTRCSTCGYVKSCDVAHTHYEQKYRETRAATCTLKPKHVLYCTYCGKDTGNDVEYGSALGHVWTANPNGRTISSATCLKPQMRRDYCTRCGIDKSTTADYAYGTALGHQIIMKKYDDGQWHAHCNRCSGNLGTRPEEVVYESLYLGDFATSHGYTWGSDQILLKMPASKTTFAYEPDGSITISCSGASATSVSNTLTASSSVYEPLIKTPAEQGTKRGGSGGIGGLPMYLMTTDDTANAGAYATTKKAYLGYMPTAKTVWTEHIEKDGNTWDCWGNTINGKAWTYSTCEFAPAWTEATQISVLVGSDDNDISFNVAGNIGALPTGTWNNKIDATKLIKGANGEEDFYAFLLMDCNLHTHNWDEGHVTKLPTPYDPGIRTYHCANLDGKCQEPGGVYVDMTEPQLRFRVYIGDVRIKKVYLGEQFLNYNTIGGVLNVSLNQVHPNYGLLVEPDPTWGFIQNDAGENGGVAGDGYGDPPPADYIPEEETD